MSQVGKNGEEQKNPAPLPQQGHTPFRLYFPERSRFSSLVQTAAVEIVGFRKLHPQPVPSSPVLEPNSNNGNVVVVNNNNGSISRADQNRPPLAPPLQLSHHQYQQQQQQQQFSSIRFSSISQQQQQQQRSEGLFFRNDDGAGASRYAGADRKGVSEGQPAPSLPYSSSLSPPPKPSSFAHFARSESNTSSSLPSSPDNKGTSLFIFDLDMTLCDSERYIPEANRECLRRVRETGTLIALASFSSGAEDTLRLGGVELLFDVVACGYQKGAMKSEYIRQILRSIGWWKDDRSSTTTTTTTTSNNTSNIISQTAAGEGGGRAASPSSPHPLLRDLSLSHPDRANSPPALVQISSSSSSISGALPPPMPSSPNRFPSNHHLISTFSPVSSPVGKQQFPGSPLSSPTNRQPQQQNSNSSQHSHHNQHHHPHHNQHHHHRTSAAPPPLRSISPRPRIVIPDGLSVSFFDDMAENVVDVVEKVAGVRGYVVQSIESLPELVDKTLISVATRSRCTTPSSAPPTPPMERQTPPLLLFSRQNSDEYDEYDEFPTSSSQTGSKTRVELDFREEPQATAAAAIADRNYYVEKNEGTPRQNNENVKSRDPNIIISNNNNNNTSSNNNNNNNSSSVACTEQRFDSLLFDHCSSSSSLTEGEDDDDGGSDNEPKQLEKFILAH